MLPVVGTFASCASSCAHLVLEAPDRETVATVIVCQVHVIVIVVQIHVIGVRLSELGRRPKVGVVAQEAEAPIIGAVAARQGVEPTAVIAITIFRPTGY